VCAPVPDGSCFMVERHSENRLSNILLPVRVHIIATQFGHKGGEGECDKMGVVRIDPVCNRGVLESAEDSTGMSLAVSRGHFPEPLYL